MRGDSLRNSGIDRPADTWSGNRFLMSVSPSMFVVVMKHGSELLQVFVDRITRSQGTSSFLKTFRISPAYIRAMENITTSTSFHSFSSHLPFSLLHTITGRLLHSWSLFLRFASTIPIWTASAPMIVRRDGRLLGKPFVNEIDGMHCKMDTIKKKTFANLCFGLNTSHK